MGSHQFEEARRKVGRVVEYSEESFGQMATYDIFFYQLNRVVTLHQNEGMEMQLTIPPGNYEIEAFAPIYNNSEDRYMFTAYLEYFLGNEARGFSEVGTIGSTVDARPYNVRIKTMSCFTQAKVIKFSLGSLAPSMVFTSMPSVTVRRVGGIRYAFE